VDIRAAFQSILADMPAYRQLLVTALERAPDPGSREQLQHALRQIDHYLAETRRTVPEALNALESMQQQAQANLSEAQAQIQRSQQQLAALAATPPPVAVPAAVAPPAPQPLPPVDPRIAQTLRAELLRYFGYQ
jgi:O6-methylguanine-DNA--protein-cysteine methyltransferase